MRGEGCGPQGRIRACGSRSAVQGAADAREEPDSWPLEGGGVERAERTKNMSSM